MFLTHYPTWKSDWFRRYFRKAFKFSALNL